MPLVSILIPTYNRESLIGDCIESALKQTESDLEIIIVDNASTDRTWELCQQYALKDSRVRIFQNKTNIGPVKNWEMCINKAAGKYGKVLFSDDLMYPSFLERTLPLIQKSNVGFVITASEVGAFPGSGSVHHQWKNRPKIFSSDKYIEDSLFSFGALVSPGAALFRIDDLKNNLMIEIPSPYLENFSSHGAGPDLLLFLLTANSYPEVAQISDPLVFFRNHDDSTTVKARKTKAWPINNCYTQARMWYVNEYSNKKLRSKSLARAWLLEILENRDFSKWSPMDVSRMYWNKVKSVSWFQFSIGLVIIFSKGIIYLAERKIRTIRER